MTEQEFRDFLITNREMLEEQTGAKLSMERIEQMVQDVQEAKRLRASQNQNRNESQEQ